MATPLLKIKLYTPPPQPEMVSRLCLIEQLNAGRAANCSPLSLPLAGFGKTTLLNEWINTGVGDTLLTDPVVNQVALHGLLKKCVI